MLLFLFFLIIKANELCDARTAICNSHGYFNINSYYFDISTYTEETTSMTAQIYRDYIKNTIQCTGKWCVENQWKCLPGDSKNCYNVEHIIPKANTILEINGCSTDIQGNLIMAYGEWNQQLSNIYYGEKVVIYGSTIFKSAYKSIYKACHGSNPLFYPDELCLSNNSGIFLALILLILTIIILITILLFYFRYKKDEEIVNSLNSNVY